MCVCVRVCFTFAFLFGCSHLFNSRQAHACVHMESWTNSHALWIYELRILVFVEWLDAAAVGFSRLHQVKFTHASVASVPFIQLTYFVLLTIMLDDFIRSKHVLCLAVALERNSMAHAH